MRDEDGNKIPKSKGKTDSVKHRMDEALSFVNEMADVIGRLLNDIPEYRNDDFIRTHWLMKYNIKTARKMLKRAQALLEDRHI